MLTGHNVLKNAASLMRHTAGCTPDIYSQAWIDHPPSSKSADDMCRVYSGPETDSIVVANKEVLNSKFTLWKNIAKAIGSYRPSCYDNGNSLGPAYHMFAFGLINFYSSSLLTYPANFKEKRDQIAVGNNDPVYRALNDMQAEAFVRGFLQRIP